MKARPYILAETNWKSVQQTDYSIAILPWGATEAHNYHLPYATDNYEGSYVAAESARLAWAADVQVIVLPTIPFGVNTGQMDIRLCMNMNPSTQYSVLKDIAAVLCTHSILKLVILNAHGGNNFKTMIRELSIDYPDLYSCSIDWWKIGKASDYFEEPGDHGGELETSVMQYIQPDLVRPLSEAGTGQGNPYTIKGLREGWVTSQRHWSSATVDTGVGNPAQSTPEKGKAFLEMTTREISQFLVELDKMTLDNLYEVK